MRYYFGWMEENKIVRPVPETTDRYRVFCFSCKRGLLMEDELIVIVIVKTQTTRFQFHEKFYREKFLPYKFRPHADLEEIARMAQQLDPNTDILSRFCICSCICISQDINSHNICLTLAIFGGDYKNG